MEYWKNQRNAAKGLSFCFTNTPVLQYPITPVLRHSSTPNNKAPFSTEPPLPNSKLRLSSKPMRDLVVAAVCMHSEPGEVDKNLGRMESFVHEASERCAGAILFPELSISGYTLKEPEKIYDPVRSRGILEKIIRMARDAKLIIMAGMVEILQEGRPYISHAVAGPEGLLGLYRKTHLSPPE